MPFTNERNIHGMRLIVVNPKQKVAVLASGLAIAATGIVTTVNAPANPDQKPTAAPTSEPAS